MREGQREIGLSVRLASVRGGSIWRWWVNLEVGHSLGGLISSWRDLAGGSIGGFVAWSELSPVLGCAIGKECVWERMESTVWERSEWGDLFSLSLSLSLSLSFSLCASDPEMFCSENKNVNHFSGQSHKTHGQWKCFSGKFYFPCATKYTVRCKIISWNGFTPKQTQPKFHSFPIKSSVNVLLVTTVNFYLFRKNVNKKSKQKANNL